MITGMRDRRRLPRTPVAVLVAGLALAAATADATYPGSNGKVALSVPAEGHDRIFLIDPDGRHLEQLTHGSTSDQAPAFSADGRWIAFDRFREHTGLGMFVVAAEGGPARHIPKTDDRDSGPAFSPNGRRIAFTSYRSGGRAEIWTRGIDGKHPRQLTHAHDESYDPAYSPDGRRIVFVRNNHLFIMRSDGSHVRRLTQGRYDGSHSFSPDGRRIVFSGNEDLYVLELNGHRLHRLTRTRSAEGGPAFSPDGREIVFSRTESVTGAGFSDRGVYMVRADGTHERRLHDLPSAGLDWQPLGAWRPTH